jgi:biopolymer transport protein ExbB
LNRLIDTWFPWLADLLELGGPILGFILIIAAVIWALLCERFYLMFMVYPGALKRAQESWWNRGERYSWYALQQRNDLVTTLGGRLTGNFPLIGTLIKICPLLGLLGTVLGMLEVFDALAATGSNNPRSMAAGVSKATVSTLAGMVVAIGALLVSTLIERRAQALKGQLESAFEFN